MHLMLWTSWEAKKGEEGEQQKHFWRPVERWDFGFDTWELRAVIIHLQLQIQKATSTTPKINDKTSSNKNIYSTEFS